MEQHLIDIVTQAVETMIENLNSYLNTNALETAFIHMGKE